MIVSNVVKHIHSRQKLLQLYFIISSTVGTNRYNKLKTGYTPIVISHHLKNGHKTDLIPKQTDPIHYPNCKKNPNFQLLFSKEVSNEYYI